MVSGLSIYTDYGSSATCYKSAKIMLVSSNYAKHYASIIYKTLNPEGLKKIKGNGETLPLRLTGEQGWRSGESTRLPPMWVEFVLVLFSASIVFLQGSPVFPPSAKTNIQLLPAGCKLCSKVTHGPYSGCQRRLCMLSVRPC